MANKKRPTPKRPPAPRAGAPLPPPAPAPARSKALPWIIGGGIAVIVAFAAIIAIAAGGGDDGDDDVARDTSPATTEAIALPSIPGDETDDVQVTAGPPSGAAEPGEYQAVTVSGDALERLPDGDDPAIGVTAPALSGFGFDGTPVTVTPGDGRPTMVVFLAHWCPHCNREVPRLVEWNDAGDVPADLNIVGVSTGARSDAPNWPPSEWIADSDWPWPVMADTEDQTAAAAYGLPGYPYFVLLGADGTVLYRESGEVPIDRLEDILADHGIQ